MSNGLTNDLAGDQLRDWITRALASYRCQFSEYTDGGAMQLVDCLTPFGDTDISRGRQELELLADHLAASVGDLIAGETRK